MFLLKEVPPHLKHIAALPCEICVQEIAILKNCVNKQLRKTHAAIQDSATEIAVEKYSSNDVSII